MSDEPNGDAGGEGKKKKGGSKQPQYAKDDQGNLILPPDMPEIDVVTWQVRLQLLPSESLPKLINSVNKSYD